MRRTRSPWQYVLFAVPAVFVVTGLVFLSKHHENSASPTVGSRAVASTDAPQVESPSLQKVKRKLTQMNADEDTPHEDLRKTAKAEPATTPAQSGMCASIEIPGKSPESVKPTDAQWDALMKEFHAAKTQDIAWLDAHKSQFSEKTVQWMRARITEAELVRPPVEDRPDLAWRGIGVADTGTKTPLIYIGGGMVKWVAEQPGRVRFELARLLAQTWAPCEVAKVDSTAPWKDLVACVDLGVEADPAKACVPGSYSEAAWAVSSVVAAAASPPGCRIPAFDSLSVSECVKKMGVHQ